jgi:hypothetical protein
VLWALFALYLVLHAVGVMQADHTATIVGALGMAVVGLALWLTAHK